MERQNTGLRSIRAQGHSAGWSCSSQWRVRNLNGSKWDLNIILPSLLIVLLCVSPSSTSKLWGWSVNACVPVSDSISKQCSLCYRGSELPDHRCSSGLPCQVRVAEVHSCRMHKNEDHGRHTFVCLSSALSWRISGFQVSGPANMNKTFKEGQNGKAQLTLNWIPQQRDAHRSAPVCFTAETNQTWEPAYGSGEVSCASDVPLKSDFCHSASQKWGVLLSWWPSPRTVKVSQPSLPCVPVTQV